MHRQDLAVVLCSMAAALSRSVMFQGLNADALTQLMQSVHLHTQTPAQPSHGGISTASAPQEGASAQTALQEGTPVQHSPGGAASSEAGPSLGFGMAGQDLLADCPLPFEEGGPGAAAQTPARARRPAKRVPVADGNSDNESRVRSASHPSSITPVSA